MSGGILVVNLNFFIMNDTSNFFFLKFFLERIIHIR